MQKLIERLMRGGTYGYFWSKLVQNGTEVTKDSLWFQARGGVPSVPPHWKDRDCYFGVHPSSVKRGGKQRARIQDIEVVNALFADIDAKHCGGTKRDAAEHVKGIPVTPSVVVDTGGGYHCYWFLDDPLRLDTPELRAETRALQAAWVKAVGGDPDAKDLARVLRVPGTHNHKPQYALPQVRVVHANYDRVYTIEALKEVIGFSYDAVEPEPDTAPGQRKIREGGGRNNDLASFAGRLRREDVVGAGLLEACRAWTRDHHDPPLEDSEVRTVVDSVMKYPEGNYFLTRGHDDAGNAECIQKLFGHMFLYCSVTGWLAYNKKYWVAGDRARQALTQATLLALKQRRLAAVRDQTADKKYAKLLSAAAGARRNVGNAQELLKSLLTADWEEFDRSPDELNCANGVLNLQTGELTPHDSKQRFTYCVPVEYNPEADSSKWTAFLSSVVLEGTDEGITPLEYIQLAMGYSITGYTREEVLFYLQGPPRGGKGTFIETLMSLLGSLGWEVAFDTFSGRRQAGSQNFDLAPLKNARFVAASEGERRTQLSAAFVKRITGGNEVFASFKHQTPFNYRPKYKIWLSSNYEPNTDPSDDGVWGRLKVIRFPNSFIGREDKTLKARLRSKDTMEGILRWLVEGAQLWYALGSQGLRTPPFVQRAVAAARDAADYVFQWADEMFEKTDDEKDFVCSARFYASYKLWYGKQGHSSKARGRRTVTADLRRLGYEMTGQGNKTKGYDRVSDVWGGGAFGVRLRERSERQKVVDLSNALAGVEDSRLGLGD